MAKDRLKAGLRTRDACRGGGMRYLFVVPALAGLVLAKTA